MDNTEETIIFEITLDNDEVRNMIFDRKILNFNIEYISNDHNEPYSIPKSIVKSVKPFEIMQEFVTAHNYSSQSIKITKPIKTSNYAQIADPITFKLFSKFCDEKNTEQAVDIIKLAEFIRFQQLTDAVSAAIATNYFIQEDQKSLDEFLKKNGLQDISSEQISEILNVYQDQFKLIQQKAKQQILKIAENEFIANQ